MKIVQVVREIHQNGGSSAVAWHLRQQFTEKGIDNDVICQRVAPGPPTSRSIEKLRHLWDVVRFSFVATFKVLTSEKEGVVVIVHNDALGGDIYVDHGLHKSVVADNPSMILRNPIHLFLLVREEIRHKFALYKRIVSLSSRSRAVLLSHFSSVRADIVCMIPNGVDLENFISRRPARDNSEFRIVFVGHEFERKGLSYLLDALSILPETVKLTVVGGSFDDVIEYRAMADRADLSGRVDFLCRRYDVADVLRSMDIIAMPSSFEAWPLVVLESMASGLPVLLTKVGGSEEMIIPGETGFIIERDAQSIASVVQLFLDDPELRDRMSAKCNIFAREYSWSAVADRYIALAREVVADRQ